MDLRGKIQNLLEESERKMNEELFDKENVEGFLICSGRSDALRQILGLFGVYPK